MSLRFTEDGAKHLMQEKSTSPGVELALALVRNLGLLMPSNHVTFVSLPSAVLRVFASSLNDKIERLRNGTTDPLLCDLFLGSMANTTNRADIMRSTAESFCSAFVSGSAPTEMLNKFFTSNPTIHEHGPSWATERLPFLGKTFQGRRQSASLNGSSSTTGNTCDDYYDLLTATLSFHPTKKTLPSSEHFIVDVDASSPGGGRKGAVTIKLQAEFKSIQTGKGWEEEFVYILSDFNEDGKIGRQELWADPLSAWVACGG